MTPPDKRTNVSAGHEVRIYYADLPPGTVGVVRKVMDREQGVLSVRIQPHTIPAAVARTYARDPADGMIAIVLTLDEWMPVSTSTQFH